MIRSISRKNSIRVTFLKNFFFQKTHKKLFVWEITEQLGLDAVPPFANHPRGLIGSEDFLGWTGNPFSLLTPPYGFNFLRTLGPNFQIYHRLFEFFCPPVCHRGTPTCMCLNSQMHHDWRHWTTAFSRPRANDVRPTLACFSFVGTHLYRLLYPRHCVPLLSFGPS